MEDCGISSVLAMEMLRSSTEPSIYSMSSGLVSDWHEATVHIL